MLLVFYHGCVHIAHLPVVLVVQSLNHTALPILSLHMSVVHCFGNLDCFLNDLALLFD
jgi:hypothetical protein